MVHLPYQAAKILFSRPKLLLLGFFPGAFTFLLSAGSVYLLWATLLQESSLWISVPAMMLGFLLSWLLFGNLSLLPVEDAIIDECQRAIWGEVRVPSPPWGLRRVGRELGYSVFLALAVLFFFFLSFLPFMGPLNFLLASWITAYGFLSTLYARQADRVGGRLQLFFRQWAPNLALGIFINMFLFIPVLNVFLLGYAQILASLVFLRRARELNY